MPRIKLILLNNGIPEVHPATYFTPIMPYEDSVRLTGLPDQGVGPETIRAVDLQPSVNVFGWLLRLHHLALLGIDGWG